MANRRMFTGYDQSDLMQPSSAMTPSGARGQSPMPDEQVMPYAEHPETMRRRLTPMVGDVQANPSAIQAFVEECAVFNNGLHDDQVDHWSQVVNWTRRRSLRPAAMTVAEGTV